MRNRFISRILGPPWDLWMFPATGATRLSVWRWKALTQTPMRNWHHSWRGKKKRETRGQASSGLTPQQLGNPPPQPWACLQSYVQQDKQRVHRWHQQVGQGHVDDNDVPHLTLLNRWCKDLKRAPSFKIQTVNTIQFSGKKRRVSMWSAHVDPSLVFAGNSPKVTPTVSSQQ